MKSASEGLVRVVTGLEGDVGYGAVVQLEGLRGAFQAQTAHVLLNRFADQRAKDPMEVVGREAGDPGEPIELERLVEVLLDVDQRAHDALVVAGSGGLSHVR